jgi:NADPH-dependent glutamate synthase beta subunit-like oxidoreductase
LFWPINLARDLDTLKKQYAAVIVATGIWNDRKLGVPGEDLPGVELCIDFLAKVYRGEINELR